MKTRNTLTHLQETHEKDFLLPLFPFYPSFILMFPLFFSPVLFFSHF